jgi:hypothetical protein
VHGPEAPKVNGLRQPELVGHGLHVPVKQVMPIKRLARPIWQRSAVDANDIQQIHGLYLTDSHNGTSSPAKGKDAFTDIEKLEKDLWEAADTVVVPPEDSGQRKYHSRRRRAGLLINWLVSSCRSNARNSKDSTLDPNFLVNLDQCMWLRRRPERRQRTM